MIYRRLILIAIAGALVGGIGATSAQAEPTNEYKIKAALIFKFLQFVEWPKEGGGGGAAGTDNPQPIVVGTVGKDPFEGALEQTMAGKSVGGRVITVKHFTSAADVKRCQVLFAGAESDGELSKVLKRLGPAGLLTIGETDQFLDDGGVIRIYEQGNNLRFEISTGAVARAGLQISAKLLRLAKLR
jgi:hypothetical protein